MDTEPTVEEQLLAYARKQTEATESLRAIAVVWSIFAVLGAVIWLITAVVAGS